MEGKLLLGQYLIWVILLLGHLHGCKSCIQKERKALLELKTYLFSKSEDHLDNLFTWTNDTKSDCCRWEGIECNRTSMRVIGLSVFFYLSKESSPLNLSLLHPFEEVQILNLNYNFSGFFDDVEGYRSLSRLRNLQILDLSSNEFNNSIFPFLNAATSLTTLSLGNNDMDGTFPIKELSHLKKLKAVDLSYNEFSISMELQELKNLTNLEVLSLAHNQLDGPIPIQVVCKMKNLRELDLSGNHFVGQLPVCLGSLHKLRVLDLSSNKLSGNLPSSFRSLQSLEYLSLLENNFTGLFSLSPLTNLTKLKVFKLSSTSDMIQVEMESTWQPEFQLSVAILRSCSLEKIPSFLVYQKYLRLVDLSSNRLSGGIPTYLLVLDFSANDISGLFPDNIGRALPNLVLMNGSNNEFQGHFPSSMGDMKNISVLDLSYNNFSGELPQSFLIGCVSLKYLKLSHNKFGGHFLPRGTSFTSLEVLKMDNNLFSGKIGVGLNSSTKLSLLDMSNNRLTGDIPSWVSKLSYLWFLLLSNNFLEGTIPLIPHLSSLDLSGNIFSGTLPSYMFATYLFLNNNSFTGPIPDTLLENVRILDLRNNKLSGRIPQFVNTTEISILLLKGNNFAGSIPRQLCDLSFIRLLDLSDNNLSGSIPSCLNNLSFGLGGIENMDDDYISSYEFGEIFQLEFYKSTFIVEELKVTYLIYQETKIKFGAKQRYDSYSGDHIFRDSFTGSLDFREGILKNMYGMDLSNNELRGVIPPELGDLLRLQVLNLSHNFLSSSIPSSFSNIKHLESLDLSYNMLHGSIPHQLTSVTSLAVWNVSYNNLSGIIPQGRQFNTFNENSYLGNPLLCGPPTNRSCETKKSTEEADNEGEEEDDEAPIDMLVFYFSTASTYVVALIGILVLMCFDSPWRREWLCVVDACIASTKSIFR